MFNYVVETQIINTVSDLSLVMKCLSMKCRNESYSEKAYFFRGVEISNDNKKVVFLYDLWYFGPIFYVDL